MDYIFCVFLILIENLETRSRSSSFYFCGNCYGDKFFVGAHNEGYDKIIKGFAL